jgi:hypothetical protein
MNWFANEKQSSLCSPAGQKKIMIVTTRLFGRNIKMWYYCVKLNGKFAVENALAYFAPQDKRKKFYNGVDQVAR